MTLLGAEHGQAINLLTGISDHSLKQGAEVAKVTFDSGRLEKRCRVLQASIYVSCLRPAERALVSNLAARWEIDANGLSSSPGSVSTASVAFPQANITWNRGAVSHAANRLHYLDNMLEGNILMLLRGNQTFFHLGEQLTNGRKDDRSVRSARVLTKNRSALRSPGVHG